MNKEILKLKHKSPILKIGRLIKYNLHFYVATQNFKKRYFNDSKNGFRKVKNLSSEEVKRYKDYWETLGSHTSLDTIEVCYSISNIFNEKIIPENIFSVDVEPTLNNRKEIKFLSNKSFYNKWFQNEIFPEDYFHKINGKLLDPRMRPISLTKLSEELENIQFPIVVKPNIDSYGGKDVFFPKNFKEVEEILEEHSDLVGQKKIQQHSFFREIYSGSMNTIRVCLYKSVEDNQYHVLNCSLRMGKNGSLDNESAGGIVCSINPHGYLNKFAVDKHGIQYNEHPNSGFKFSSSIPNYSELCRTSIELAEKIYYARLISLDMCLDENNKWRAIEVNLEGQTIRFAQYAGEPFFGSFTDEVKQYCEKNHWVLQ